MNDDDCAQRCEDCGQYLGSHTHQCPPKKMHTCLLCQREFTSLTYLNKHQKTRKHLNAVYAAATGGTTPGAPPSKNATKPDEASRKEILVDDILPPVDLSNSVKLTRESDAPRAEGGTSDSNTDSEMAEVSEEEEPEDEESGSMGGLENQEEPEEGESGCLGSQEVQEEPEEGKSGCLDSQEVQEEPEPDAI